MKPIGLATSAAYRKVLSAHKLRLRRDGHDIARYAVEPLVEEPGSLAWYVGGASVR